MESLLEYIVPIIIGAFYLFNFLKKGDDEGESDLPPRQPASREDAEAIERQRKVQEEIRRKIMERRQATERGQTIGPTPTSNAPESAYDRQQRERREANRAQLEPREVVKEVKPPPIQKQVQPLRRAESKQSAGGFSWDTSDNAYETQMQERLRQIEATKREAEKLKKRTASKRTDSKPKRQAASGRSFSGPIRDQLKDPAAARAAFIYGEVLGQPVSTRKQSSVPGLS